MRNKKVKQPTTQVLEKPDLSGMLDHKHFVAKKNLRYNHI